MAKKKPPHAVLFLHTASEACQTEAARDWSLCAGVRNGGRGFAISRESRRKDVETGFLHLAERPYAPESDRHRNQRVKGPLRQRMR